MYVYIYIYIYPFERGAQGNPRLLPTTKALTWSSSSRTPGAKARTAKPSLRRTSRLAFFLFLVFFFCFLLGEAGVAFFCWGAGEGQGQGRSFSFKGRPTSRSYKGMYLFIHLVVCCILYTYLCVYIHMSHVYIEYHIHEYYTCHNYI